MTQPASDNRHDDRPADQRIVPLNPPPPVDDDGVFDSTLSERRLLTSASAKDMVNAYNTVRARVLAHIDASSDARIAVVSPVSSDGKSLTAANVAISISRDLSHCAALVDFDLHRPSLAELFDLDVDRGVDDYLLGQDIDLAALGKRTAYEGLTVFPVRRPRARASELVATERADALLTAIGQRDPSTVVIVDLPPLLATPDARLTATRCGGALMIIRDGHTPADMIERAIELLDGATLIGAVLNESDDVANSYYAY